MFDHPPPALVIGFLLSVFAFVISIAAILMANNATRTVRLYRFTDIERGVIHRLNAPPPDTWLAEQYCNGDLSEYTFERLCIGHYTKKEDVK